MRRQQCLRLFKSLLCVDVLCVTQALIWFWSAYALPEMDSQLLCFGVTDICLTFVGVFSFVWDKGFISNPISKDKLFCLILCKEKIFICFVLRDLQWRSWFQSLSCACAPSWLLRLRWQFRTGALGGLAGSVCFTTFGYFYGSPLANTFAPLAYHVSQVIDFDADLENGESIHQEITKKHKHRRCDYLTFNVFTDFSCIALDALDKGAGCQLCHWLVACPTSGVVWSKLLRANLRYTAWPTTMRALW